MAMMTYLGHHISYCCRFIVSCLNIITYNLVQFSITILGLKLVKFFHIIITVWERDFARKQNTDQLTWAIEEKLNPSMTTFIDPRYNSAAILIDTLVLRSWERNLEVINFINVKVLQNYICLVFCCVKLTYDLNNLIF